MAGDGAMSGVGGLTVNFPAITPGTPTGTTRARSKSIVRTVFDQGGKKDTWK